MTRYKDARALRQALEARLKQESDSTGTDLGRLRRRVVFDRLATRLAVTGGWVLKGGAVMEFRFREKARMTKDLDLATRLDRPDGEEVREILIEALSRDMDGDMFTFRVGPASPLSADTAGRPAWRFSVEAWLAGKPFAGVRLDAAARGEELTLTEPLQLPGTMVFAGMPVRSIEAVDRRQHFAEKLHAMTRDYGNRPNTRVKDLADLVVLIENGLIPDRSLVDTVRHVFTVRATHPVPEEIPDPPPAWETGYSDLAQNLTDTPADLFAALKLLRGFWAEALNHPGTER